MFDKIKKINVLDRKKINYAELDKELKVELSILGGLDIFTSAHIIGVANNTQKICVAMDLDYETTKHCMLSAYMHDVGKIKIPSAILQKQDKLTEEEYEIMKMHTIYGYEIVMGYDQFKYLAPIVRGHHENLDGSGYPDGLTDREITEETKLIKIADIYDALTQKRQYKEGFAPSQAVSIILDDVRKGKTGSKYLYFLLVSIIREQQEKFEGNRLEYLKTKQDIETLKELDKIYKEIYDRGFSPALSKKLDRYELSPGYDMSTNSNLLSRSISKLETLEKILKEQKEEIEKLTKQMKEAKKLIKSREWNVKLFGKSVI